MDETVTLTHIGGPTLLIETRGWTILSDPTFDAPGRKYSFGWGTSSVKTAGPAVSIDDLPPIDLVVLSHDHHGDNLDDAGRALLGDVGQVITTRAGARRLGRLRAASRRRASDTGSRPRCGPQLHRRCA